MIFLNRTSRSPLRQRRGGATWTRWSPVLRLAFATLVFAGCGEDQTETPPEVTQRESELLQAIGYLGWSETSSELAGVTTHNRDRVSTGFTLYPDQVTPSAYVMDMDGKVLHTWSARGAGRHWHHVEALPNGDLLAIAQNESLSRLRWDSSEVWRLPLRAHHDFDIAAGGRIFALIRRTVPIVFENAKIQVIEDGIAILAPSGELLQEIWLLEALRPILATSRLKGALEAQWYFLEREERLEVIAKLGAESSLSKTKLLAQAAAAIDLMHTNSIEILDRDVPGLGSRSQILLSMRNLSRLVLLDSTAKQLEWSWGEGEISGQHQATVLDNGHILLFDNRMVHEDWSRVIEVDPVAGEVVWSHPRDIPVGESFYSRQRSGAQQLPNGNVLVTVGKPGQIFEVSRDHERVWEWNNPVIQDGKRAALYRSERLPSDYFKDVPPDAW